MTVEEMIRKKPWRESTTGSSCSGETAPLRAPKGALELGIHLVQELDLRGRDTLDRWMAHHLAELIEEAQTQNDPRRRESARRRASELVLKIWDRRTSLSQTANPLVNYEPALAMLINLKEETNPFARARTGRQGLARRLYDNFQTITKVLVQLELPKTNNKSKPSLASPGARHLPKKEKELLGKLNELLGSIDPTALHDIRMSTARANDPRLHLQDLIKDTTNLLKELRKLVLSDKPQKEKGRHS